MGKNLLGRADLGTIHSFAVHKYLYYYTSVGLNKKISTSLPNFSVKTELL